MKVNILVRSGKVTVSDIVFPLSFKEVINKSVSPKIWEENVHGMIDEKI